MKKSDILLIEDNPNDILLMKRAFQKGKLANRLIVMSDGEEALAYLRKEGAFADAKHALPDLILLDLNLPKIDGFEVLKMIRGDETLRYIPVVVLTTSNEQRDILKSYKEGANSFVQKPLEFSEFVAAVQQLGLYWMVLNRPFEP